MSSSNQQNLILRRVFAYGVHLFTASGAVLGLLTIPAILQNNWRMAIFWMVLAILVDSFDGMLARWAEVQKYATRIDGALLDNIVDYLNYVFVPAFAFIVGDFLPSSFRVPVVALILLTSAYQFTQVDAKTDESHDYFFKGFPCYWNMAVLYMLVLQLNPWVNLTLLVLCNILIFVPVKYVYPSRNGRLRKLTLILSYLYGIFGVWALIQYPHIQPWLIWVSFVYVAYYLGLSLWPRRKESVSLV